jgi:hypothetical protein
MRRPWRASAALLVGVAVAIAAAAGSCTTFDNVTLPADDAGFDATNDTGLPPPPADAGEAGEAEAGPPPPGYLSVPDAARVCSTVFKCPQLASSILQSSAVPVDPVNYALCVEWLAGPVPADRVGFAVQAQTFSCIAQATTCAQAGSCLSLENLDPGDPRCADAGADAAERCADDGGTVMRCADGYVLHCGSAYYGPGSQCMQGDDGTHWCSTGKNCNVQISCIGTLLDYCGAGSNLHESVNCAFDGYTCDTASNDDSGLPGCNTGNLYKPCSNAGTSCAGDVVDVCDGYTISEFDCASMGARCSATNGPALCVRPGDACTPFDADENVCTGTSISLCVGGQKQKLDCASLGLSCVPGAGAASAHCG